MIDLFHVSSFNSLLFSVLREYQSKVETIFNDFATILDPPGTIFNSIETMLKASLLPTL